MNSEPFEISRLSKSDIDLIHRITPTEWGDVRQVFHHFYDYEGFYAIKVTTKGLFVGVGEAILNKNTGWVGNIIVDPEFRNQGLGRKITEHLTSYVESNGRASVILLATEMGQHVYKKIGFQHRSEYSFFMPESRSNMHLQSYDSRQIKPFNPNYFQEIKKLDQETCGEDRTELLHRNVKNAVVYLEEKSQRVIGYCIPNLGNGLVIAKERKAGIELLKYKLSVGPDVIICPDESFWSIDFAKENGYQLFRKAYKMIKGSPIYWKPENIFCRIGGYLG